MVSIGQRFVVSEAQEITNARGRRIANYLPGFDYRVTERNLPDVAALVASGKASVGTAADAERAAAAAQGMHLSAGAARVTGRAKT